MLSSFPYYLQGFTVEREKVTPAVGIVFNDEEEIYNLSGYYNLFGRAIL
jgi:hypothetical protein